MVYIQQLEEENEQLHKKLALAEERIDHIDNNQLQVALEMLIGVSLERQRKIIASGHAALGSVGNMLEDVRTLRISLPRGLGLSTALPQACLKYFETVDILTNMRDVPRDTRFKYHMDTNFLKGRVIECIIVDPWSHMFRGSDMSNRWCDAQGLIGTRMKKDTLSLMILAG